MAGPYLHNRYFASLCAIVSAGAVRAAFGKSFVNNFESSMVGTAIQFSGTILVTILCAILLRTIRRQFLYYWAVGWCALSLALASLLASFALKNLDPACGSWQWLFFTLYCFGEYTAGFLWIAGCCNLAGDYRLSRRDWAWCIRPPASPYFSLGSSAISPASSMA